MPRRPIPTDECCEEGCDLPRRPAGHGRSRFCYKHHHLHYTRSDPEKMKRKREAEISRRERNGERDPEQPVQSRGSYDYVPRKYK